MLSANRHRIFTVSFRCAGAALVTVAALAVTARATPTARSGPDPATQAVVDGCTRNAFALATRGAPIWVYVGDGGKAAAEAPPPPRWVRGVADAFRSPLGVHPTPIDNPFAHDSYDVIVNVRTNAAGASLLAGDPAARTGNYEGDDEESRRLHMEREEAGFPPAFWPEPGDRVQALGSWVWDCGHWTPGGERTEFHPIRLLWVERRPSPRSPSGENEGDLFYSGRKTPAGVEADCAHRAKADLQAFQACLPGEPRTFSSCEWTAPAPCPAPVLSHSFFLPAPPRPSPRARLSYRVVDESPKGGVKVQLRRGGASVAVRSVNGAPVAARVFLGWRPSPSGALPRHLRVRFDELLVRRAMDPGCSERDPACPFARQSTRLGQISKPPGEWQLYVDVGGIWRHLRPFTLRVRDGQRVRLGAVVDVYAPAGRAPRILVFTRECDFGRPSFDDQLRPPSPCPRSDEFGALAGDDVPGIVVARATQGLHRVDARRAGSTCPAVNRHGCYRLTFTVMQLAVGRRG
jgi:hypothetical protein